MEPIIFKYRSRQLTSKDIELIKATIDKHYAKGRSKISRILCECWGWVQPNGKLKEYPARDLLLRLEEHGFVKLPPRINSIYNRKKQKSFNQIPLFIKHELHGSIGNYPAPVISLISQDRYLWEYLVHHYHYLDLSTLVGEHVRHIVFINDQVVACLAWASAAWKVRARDEFIGWDENVKRKNLYLIANNTRFLVLPWIKVKHLASKVLSQSLKRLTDDWQKKYEHPVYLAETFVDNTRFKGTCYKAANWRYVGQTSGSAKKGNTYRYHGQPKSIYLYPLHRHFRRMLNDDQG